MSELAPNITPYRYGFNNPIYWQDRTGLFESEMEAKSFALRNNLSGFELYKRTDGLWGVDHNSISYVRVGEKLQVAYLIKDEMIFELFKYDGTTGSGGGSGSGSNSGSGGSLGVANNISGIPTACCHHNVAIPNGSNSSFLGNSFSGYIQYGGGMSSGFIGSSLGSNGVLYGSMNNIYSPSLDLNTRVNLLKHISTLMDGISIGQDLIDSFFPNNEVDIRSFNYIRTDTIWFNSFNPVGAKSRAYDVIISNGRGYIINGDTIR
ncbi:hypothetical protein AB4865_05830 [Capnocytophaga sp. ARDL2]|uniref:hypothetical protein n=1 Tax=Capnocytophaga sp. ARDL2 TaxID=3238809 RepID=UPI0035569AFC